MKKRLQPTSGFTQAGVYARRQFCADIQVCSPQELLCNPRLREAAATLAATRRQRTANWQSGDNEEARPVKPLEQEKKLIIYVTDQ